MMARPASLAQIIIAGALGSPSSASAGIRVSLYSDGGLITALVYHHCTPQFERSLCCHNNSFPQGSKVTIKRIRRRSETRSAWLNGSTGKYERGVGSLHLYHRQNKEAWCASETTTTTNTHLARTVCCVVQESWLSSRKHVENIWETGIIHTHPLTKRNNGPVKINNGPI
ncbi:unnamed protein product [Colias eurytheme]|nr:unnamed protein product [Colias eurytheme]